MMMMGTVTVMDLEKGARTTSSAFNFPELSSMSEQVHSCQCAANIAIN